LDQVIGSLKQRKLMLNDEKQLACTAQGHVFLNSVLE
ncbi:hypothetical protein ACG904_20870, partial [Acinetobacter guillouiae]